VAEDRLTQARLTLMFSGSLTHLRLSHMRGTTTEPTAPPDTAAKWPYLPGLDGVRAIAVAGVLLFHLPARLLPGGFLGVDVFFVLSGFLITSLLLRELEQTNRLRFGEFYRRRFRRLLPALLAMLVVTSVLVLTIARDAAAVFRQDAIAALTYSTNWWYIFDDRSYFEALGRPPLLQHLWSLGIEEQFYLVWPTVLYFAWRRWRRQGVGLTAIVGAVVSTAWMAWLAVTTDVPAFADTARVYFGADTHAMTVLVGAALATVWQSDRLPRQISRSAQHAVSTVGVVTLLGIGAIFLLVSDSSAWLFRGGFLLVAFVSALLIAMAAHPAGNFGTALGNPVMHWIGTRSYGIYLWHWPIFLVTRPDLDLPYGGWAAAATSLALTGVVSEASYRWIEMPVRHGALVGAFARLRSSVTHRNRALLIAAVSVTTVVAGAGALAAVPAVDSSDYLGGATSVGAGDLVVSGDTGAEPSARSKDPDKATEPGDRSRSLTRHRITAVGDSVLLGARISIARALPRVTIDAAISRQPADIIDRVYQRLRAGQLANVVILQIGTNGIPSAADLNNLYRRLHDRDRIVVVNVKSPVPWMDQSNRALETSVTGVDNVVIADWANAGAGHREYFAPDGTHLTTRGIAAYVRTIEDALQ
jgi:peptidoglycan/LPS O-acetylase OafA/YrhL